MDRAEAIKFWSYEHKAVTDGYTTYLANGGANDPRTEEWLDAMEAAIAAMREQESLAEKQATSEWVSVKERLPDNKEHDWVLAQVVEDNGFMHIPKVMEYRQNRDDWFEETYGWLSAHNGAFIVTHWMPLPTPPKEGQERTCKTCYGNDMEHDEVDNPCWNCKGDHSEWMPKEGADNG